MAGWNNDAFPGAGGHVRRIEAGEMRILLRGGTKKPVGWYIAKMENGLWMGADTHFGAIPKRFSGSFREVIEWLIPPTGVTQNMSREREWKAGVSPAIPVRIEGAEIRDWPEAKETAMGFDGTPAAGKSAAYLTRSRLRGGAKTGSMTTAQAMERDRRILELMQEGKTEAEIAPLVGLVPSSVSRVLKRLQAEDPSIPRGKRQIDRDEVERRDRKILECLRGGMSQVEIADRMGLERKLVNHRVDVMRRRGVRIPDVWRERQQALSASRLQRAMVLRKEGLSNRKIAAELGVGETAVRRWLREYAEEGGTGNEMQGG